ncbi:MAG: T9SS type A sorting domain-containing protein [Bacteroidota bacterium]
MKKQSLLLTLLSLLFCSTVFGQTCLVENECDPSIDNQFVCEDIIGGTFFPDSENCDGNGILVPVELVFFEGKVTKAGIELYWQTASEFINEGFEIQRSTDAKTWESLDFVKGHGTTLELQNYKWTDVTASANTNYYRLKQLDMDGVYEYSEIIALNKAGVAKSTLVIAPNPVGEILHYQLVEQRQAIQSLQIYDLSGRLVKGTTDQVTALPIHDLEKGTYILVAEIGNERLRATFIKQ